MSIIQVAVNKNRNQAAYIFYKNKIKLAASSVYYILTIYFN